MFLFPYIKDAGRHISRHTLLFTVMLLFLSLSASSENFSSLYYFSISDKSEVRVNGQTKSFDSLHPKATGYGKKYMISSDRMYMDAGVNIGTLTGLSVGFGGYIHDFNVQLNFICAFSYSENIYWVGQTEEVYPLSANYFPFGGSAVVGYGFRIHDRIELTPQAGCRMIMLSERIRKGGNYYETTHWPFYSETVADKCSAASFSIGVRGYAAVFPWLGLFVKPEYIIPFSRSEGFKALADVSSCIRGYAGGFNCYVGFNISF